MRKYHSRVDGMEPRYSAKKPGKTTCLKCNESFYSEDKRTNRVCLDCKVKNSRVSIWSGDNGYI